MILDTSAIIAVIDGESRASRILDALRDARGAKMSAATAVELTAVLTRYRDVAIHGFAERTLADWGVEIVPFDAQQSRVAQQAYRDYGRGSGHPARLNMGDCYSYALAAVLREPLLYVGDDFVHTDIPSALG